MREPSIRTPTAERLWQPLSHRWERSVSTLERFLARYNAFSSSSFSSESDEGHKESIRMAEVCSFIPFDVPVEPQYNSSNSSNICFYSSNTLLCRTSTASGNLQFDQGTFGCHPDVLLRLRPCHANSNVASDHAPLLRLGPLQASGTPRSQ